MKNYLLFPLMLLSACFFMACSNDDDDNVAKSDITGTWYATVGSGKGSISLTFDTNGTGSLHYCWDNVIFHTVDYAFTYSIKGNEIQTAGTFVDSDPDIGVTEGSMNFTYADGKLTGGRWGTDNGYSKKKTAYDPSSSNNSNDETTNEDTTPAISLMGYWVDEERWNICKEKINYYEGKGYLDPFYYLNDTELCDGVSGWYFMGSLAYEIHFCATTNKYGNNPNEGNKILRTWTRNNDVAYFMQVSGSKFNHTFSITGKTIKIGYNSEYTVRDENHIVTSDGGTVYVRSNLAL